MAEPSNAEKQIKDAAWTYGGWFVLLALTLGAGIALGYIFWGDALILRKANAELEQKILVATGEKENALHQKTMAEEQLTRCERKLNPGSVPPAPSGE